MRSARFIVGVAVALLATTVAAAAAPPAPLPSPSPPTVDGGSKTSGLAGEPVPQPSPAPRIHVDPDGPAPPDRGPDTPGKTGLGNTDRGALGGADTGPGTQDVVPRNAE